ncbi:universal stress protein [Nocardiopsis suaedae]|uniref:Universal stress protein n=1 Tax=Nocardiopsis suaedae TaxID=3018444 RepID=A0ABT4TJD9_9ACTN|nr:universal stress protein [Nocardiopsis suaedae]MDA2804820.1 universal stress protein [Nocardiopsis suaedae]
MTTKPDAPVLAAVNGTEASLRALDWAADEALMRGRSLRIVYAFDWPLYHRVPLSVPGFSAERLAQSVVDEAVQRAAERAPDLRTAAVYKVGDAAPVLMMESAEAELAVIGSRVQSRIGALLLGSTGMELAAAGRCPVVVVPDHDPKPPVRRIVVGLDGSASARTAAAWAFAAAARRGAALRAVIAHDPLSHRLMGRWEAPVRDASDQAELEEAAQEARRLLSESLAGLREHHPQVEVEESAVPGHPAQVLADASAGSDLLVVGSRGRGGFTGMLLGSVSQSALTHASVPVAVVPAETH